MQTDILLKQLNSSLAELKLSIEKFEKHPSPSTHEAEKLYAAIGNSNKLVAAFLVLKERKDVSPDLDLHMKLMEIPTPEEKKVIVDVEPKINVEKVEEPVKVEPVKVEQHVEPIVLETPVQPIVSSKKEFPKITININDKFRFINELFKINTKEYDIAIEQLNVVNSLEEANAYLKGLKDIYGWDEQHEMVKKLYALTHKRFF